MTIVVLLPLFLLLLGSGLLIGLALLATGVTGIVFFADVSPLKLIAFQVWQSLNAPELAALILFVLMGELLFITRTSERLFKGLAPLAHHLPGGLLHVNVAGCTLFAAVSGSSAATTATVGRLTLPELEARGYDPKLAIGSLCGAGTLGFLIPPSIVLILYGVLAEVSIVDLFIAGILPGILLALALMGVIAFLSSAKPGQDQNSKPSMKDVIELLPVGGLLVLVLGSMIAGIAGPSEAAVIGCTGALVIGGMERSLTLFALKKALLATVRTVSMVGLILVGALFLTKVMAFLGLAAWIQGLAASLTLPPLLLILCLLAGFIIMGTVLDGLSLIVMALPIALPLVMAAGYDPLWFAIFLVITVEMAQITPPVGFNLFVVNALTGKPVGWIARAALPFFLVMAAFALALAIFPQIATFLPELL